MKMKTIGVDLHKETVVVCVLNEDGTVLERKTMPTKCRNQIREYFASYGLQCQVAVECVGFYQWFWELLSPIVGKIELADPARVRAFSGRDPKTDPRDARLLATLQSDGRLPKSYIPKEPARTLRDLVRLRHSLARSLASERKHLRWVSLKMNLPGPSVLSSDRAQKWLLANEPKFPESLRTAARLRLDHIIDFERNVADLDRTIAEYAAKSPEMSTWFELLQTIPGVGEVVAATIIAETGDITRFANTDQLGAYAGLVPRVSQSGATVHHGHITKQGPPLLRWVLQQAAWVAIRSSEEARRIFCRIARKAGQKKAATALARKILCYAWSVCRKGSPFEWPEAAKAKRQAAGLEPKTQNMMEGAWCFQI
jgi:transposase